MLQARFLVVGLVALGFSLSGCQVGPRVRYAPTDTPGLIYVIVSPSFLTSHTAEANAESDYILLCNFRGTGGGDCEIPAEVAKGRLSKGPTADRAPAIDTEVGSVTRAPVELPKPSPKFR